MASPSKRKGVRFETEVVRCFTSAGMEADRSWGSDGRTRGLPGEVDVVVKGGQTDLPGRPPGSPPRDLHLQCKRSALLPVYLARFSDNGTLYDGILLEETSTGCRFAVLHLERFAAMLSGKEALKESGAALRLRPATKATVGADYKPLAHIDAQVLRADRSPALIVLHAAVYDELFPNTNE